MFHVTDVGPLLAATCGFTALVCYLMCGSVARRAPTLGGGTYVLSWIGLCVPCIAWIALYQEHAAVTAYARAAAGPHSTSVKQSFNRWLIAYVVFMLSASLLAKIYGAVKNP